MDRSGEPTNNLLFKPRSSLSPITCVDVHTHLTDSRFDELAIKDVIERAKQNNVVAAVVVTESLEDFEPVKRLHSLYPEFVLPFLGIHPIQSSGSSDERGLDIKRSVSLQDYAGVEPLIAKFAAHIGGIGEIGLDFTPRFCKTEDDKESQRLIFSNQVKLAQSLQLAVNVHSRSAGRQAIQMLRELDAKQVLLHAFDGRASVAAEGASHGFYFSVPASIGRDTQVQKMVRSLPMDRLVLETDSPALAPVKGEVNEPANVVIACEHIAKLKHLQVDIVKQMTTENALKIFPKLRDLLTSERSDKKCW